MSVKWHPEILNAKLDAAFKSAAAEFYGAAVANFPSRAVAHSLRFVLRGLTASVESDDPRVLWIEKGVGEHIIEPKEGTVLRLADGSFVTGPVRHPGMGATPTLEPLLEAFPTLFRRRAAALL